MDNYGAILRAIVKSMILYFLLVIIRRIRHQGYILINNDAEFVRRYKLTMRTMIKSCVL